MDTAGEAAQGCALRRLRAVRPGAHRPPDPVLTGPLTRLDALRYDALRQTTKEEKTMSTETNQIADRAATVEEVAFGAAKSAAEMAADPIGSARKQVKALERKGTPTARKVNRRFTARL